MGYNVGMKEYPSGGESMTEDMRAEILLVEDDEDIREGVRILLESENYVIREAGDGPSGLRLLTDDTDLVILDVMMPGMSGLRVCEEIRKTSNVPVLFLTAKAQESDKLIGLMAGGDDYLTKPFSYSELLGRVKALIRRYNVYRGRETEEIEEKPVSDDRLIVSGGIAVYRDHNEATLDGREISLTEKEYGILKLLMEHPGEVFSAQSLYEAVWEEEFFFSCNSTVMVHVRNLRTKIEFDPQNPKRLCTVWGKGYRFENK